MSLSIVPPVQSNNVIPFIPAGKKVGELAIPPRPGAELLRLNGGVFPKRENGLRLVSKVERQDNTQGQFFCLHIPQFPAWVALQADKSLKDVPFAVHNGESVVAVSPMARRAGVGAGQNLAAAENRCPRLRLLRTHTRRESVAWQEVVREVSLLTPRVEIVEPGFLMADASQVDPTKLAALVKSWGVPAGMARDRATAHLAALNGEPGKVRSVEPGFEHEFARTTPVTLLRLVGVQEKSLARMAWFGWNHIEALRALSLTQLREQFGPDATVLWRYGQAGRAAENVRPVGLLETPDRVEARRRFMAGLRTAEDQANALYVLLSDVLEEAGENQAQIIELKVETTIGSVSARRVLRDPAAAWGHGALRDLEHVVEELLCEALGGARALAPAVTALEISLGGFHGALTGKVAAKRNLMGRQGTSALAA